MKFATKRSAFSRFKVRQIIWKKVFDLANLHIESSICHATKSTNIKNESFYLVLKSKRYSKIKNYFKKSSFRHEKFEHINLKKWGLVWKNKLKIDQFIIFFLHFCTSLHAFINMKYLQYSKVVFLKNDLLWSK